MLHKMVSAAACSALRASISKFLMCANLSHAGVTQYLNSCKWVSVPVKHIPVISDDGFYIARNLVILFMLKHSFGFCEKRDVFSWVSRLEL